MIFFNQDDFSTNYGNEENEGYGVEQINFDQNENDQNGGDQNQVQERKEIMQEFLKRLDQAGADSRVTFFHFFWARFSPLEQPVTK